MTFEIIFISFKKVRVFIFDLNSIFADFFFNILDLAKFQPWYMYLFLEFWKKNWSITMLVTNVTKEKNRQYYDSVTNIFYLSPS